MNVFYPVYPSVLQAEMLVKWKRERGLYNFEVIPDQAIICVDYSICKHFDSFLAKKIKGIKGKNFVAKDILFCSEFDNGGPGIINLLEELRALGIKRFVFIGFAGRLTKDLREGTIFAIDKAISCSGITPYYSEHRENEPYDKPFFKEMAEESGCKLNTCVSVDTPFRETRPLLDEAVSKGAHLIEMECAAVYAFSHFYQLSGICFLIAADSLFADWHPPTNSIHTHQELREFVRKLIFSLNKK